MVEPVAVGEGGNHHLKRSRRERAVVSRTSLVGGSVSVGARRRTSVVGGDGRCLWAAADVACWRQRWHWREEADLGRGRQRTSLVGSGGCRSSETRSASGIGGRTSLGVDGRGCGQRADLVAGGAIGVGAEARAENQGLGVLGSWSARA
ncbi:hypothetical protein NL676_007113 [Syzygium grande]|nr:hypothetical protein NL676_007113 [Syzygium grande]